MSIIHKVKHRQSSIINLWFFATSKQVYDVVLSKQGATENSHNLTNISVEFEVMLYDGNEAVCYDNGIDLYVYGIHSVSPEILDPKILLNKFEQIM